MPPKPATIIKAAKKPALILVHGFRGSPRGLETIANDLQKADYKVFLPALPPFAGSKLKSYSPRTYTEYLYDYIKTNQITRPVLIGHSMGSIVVTAMAQRYPELVHRKLVLLSPISTKPPRFIAQISPLANYLPNKVVDFVTTKFLFVPHNKKLWKKTMSITHQCSEDQPPSKAELSGAMKFSTSYSVADFLEGLQKDIFMIAGAEDRLISQKATRELAQNYDATLEFIPESGHLHNYEKPHETAELILQALQN